MSRVLGWCPFGGALPSLVFARRRHREGGGVHVVTADSMFERRRHALGVAMALLGVAFVLTVAVVRARPGSVVQRIDDRWLAWMVELRTPWGTSLARAVSVLGGPLVVAPLRLIVVAALAWRRRWLQFGAFLGAMVTSELCIGPLKAFVDRPRPPDPLVHSSSSSFPSGHAIAASVTAIGLVVVLVPAAGRRRTRWTVLAAAFAALMAMSRTFLGVHWLSDVVAGACIGTGLAVAWPASLELGRDRWRSGPRGDARDPSAAHRFDALRVLSVVLLAVGAACVALLHVLRPDLDPAADRISEYAIGPYGPVMAAGFLAIGAGLLVMATVVVSGRDRWWPGVAGAIGVAGIGMAVAGIWRTDPDRSGVLTDTIHSRASALATVALIGAALAWSVLRRWPVRFAGAALLAILAAVLGLLSPVLHGSAWTGASQRLLWATLLSWLILAAWQLTPRPAADVRNRSAEALTMGS